MTYEFRHDLLDFKDFGLSIGVKVPITSSIYGYTKVLAHNLNKHQVLLLAENGCRVVVIIFSS